MLKLEARPEPSRLMSVASPLLALAITVVIGTCLFMMLGKDPVQGLQVFFVEPVKSLYALSELAMKATPLILIALGLAVCFRSNVWNIGAEGQFILGAVFAGGVAMQARSDNQPLDRRARPAGRRARRHVLGGDRRAAARPLQRQRDPGQPDARLRGRHAAELPRLRPVEGPGRATTSRRPSPSPRRPRSRDWSTACAPTSA